MNTPVDQIRGQNLIKYQSNHTIPWDLFDPKTGTPHPLLGDFKRLDGWQTAFDFENGAENRQRLPAIAFDEASSVHRGSHPAITELMSQRLDQVRLELRSQNASLVSLAESGDLAAQHQWRDIIAGRLGVEVEDFQFRSTNFMDQGTARNRLIYNAADLDYLRQTPTYTNATELVQRAADRKDPVTLANLIRAHNQAVISAPIEGDTALARKVLRDLGQGLLAHTDATPEARDDILALVAEARRQGFDLNTRDTFELINIVEIQHEQQVASLTNQIDALTAQINAAPEAQRAALRQQAQELWDQRKALYEQQTYGDASRSVPAQRIRATIQDVLENGRFGRKVAGLLAKQVLKRVGGKLIPIYNAYSTAEDIYDLGRFAIFMLTPHPELQGDEGGTSTVFQTLMAGGAKRVAAVENEAGDTNIAVVDSMVVLKYSRRTGEFLRFDNWYYIGDPALDLMPLSAPVDKLLEVPENGGPVRSIDVQLTGSTVEVQTIESSPIEQRQSVASQTAVFAEAVARTTYDADGNVVSRDSDNRIGVYELDALGNFGRRLATVSLNYETMGSMLGSSFARVLQIDNPWLAIGAGTLLDTVGANLGQAIDAGGLTSKNLEAAFGEFGLELREAGAGALSSYLFAELVNELGLDPRAAQALSATGGAAISTIAQNLAANRAWNLGANGQPNVGPSVVSAAGSFLGTMLASKLVEFDTIGGQLGASIGSSAGSAVGAMNAAKMFPKIYKLNELFAQGLASFIGSLIGFLSGGLLGGTFGGTPRSGADVNWNGREFQVTRSWAKNGASHEAARSLAGGVAGVLNGVIAATGSKLLDTKNVQVGSFGTYKKDFVYRPASGPQAGQVTFSTRDAEALIRTGAVLGLVDIVPRLAGGDTFVKRAIAVSIDNALILLPPNRYMATTLELNTVLGNMAVAQDYGAYRSEAATIDALIAADPTSSYAATWVATLAKAYELGLHKRRSTDWTGGWTAYMDEALDRAIDGRGYAPTNLQFGFHEETGERLFGFVDADGDGLGVLGDTIDTASKDHIHGTDNADTIIVTGDRIANPSGLTINDEAGSSSGFDIRVAATISGGGGDDFISAGDLGNDVFGGDGDDTLVGGKLDDWQLGEAGNDRLFAGAANHQFADGDLAATAAALATESNGDLLDGGEGNDVLYGSRGSDWLQGGDGTDALYGGAGGDILDGGAGDDSGPSGEARLFGGAGTDQYVFGYGSGVDVVFDESDNAAVPGGGTDSISQRISDIQSNPLLRDWGGTGDYEVDGSVVGGEDAIAFGQGIDMADLILDRVGRDLVIILTYETGPNTRAETGDQIVIKDWFETKRRVEWLRFADGEEVRIGDIQSFILGNAANNIIVGTNGADFMYGGGGDDVLFGLQGDDFGFGGAGNDYVAGDGNNDWVAGGLNDDKVFGGVGNDTVFGDSGNDEVNGGAGKDIIVGGRGDDLMVGGPGTTAADNDYFRYQRGDGRDVIIDSYVNNWDLVWQNGFYTNNYVLDTATGRVLKNGQVYFDGSEWIGQYEYDAPTATFRRHLGLLSGALGVNAGTDYLEFGVGIDIQDLMLRLTGNDLEIAIGLGDNDATAFTDVADRITIRDWRPANSIENFVFVATGQHTLTGWSLGGGTEGADNFTGGSSSDWYTGLGGDDTLTGNGGNDILVGNGGADVLKGGAGDDALYGGDNDDTLNGGLGGDALVGGRGVDVASYLNAAANIRAFLNAPSTNSSEGIRDQYIGIEGIEGTTGVDVLGGDANANVLRGLGGADTLYGGAGDDIYEINTSNGADTIRDLPFVTEEIVTSDTIPLLNTALFAATWTNTSFDGTLWYYQLVVTRIGTSEEVYRSGPSDFAYSSPASNPPSPSAWPTTGWLPGNSLATTPTATGNGSQRAREVFQNTDGGSDALDFGPNIGLTDLTFQRLNGNADLQVTYGSSQTVTIVGQNAANSAIESLQLRDGLTVDLTRLVLLGEAASGAADFMVGNTSANTLDGLAGDDVLSGLAGNDILRGGDGDDVLEGGAGNDTLDGGNDSVSAGLPPSTTDHTRAYGDTIRYVRSPVSVTIDLGARTATGPSTSHALGDIIAAGAGGVSSIENVIGSEAGGDTLSGDARANRLVGLAGNDVLDGRAGNDVLIGGIGTDQLFGGDGDDNLAGEDDGDTLEGGNGNDLLAGGSGNDTMRGDAGEDLLSGGDGVDTMYGGADDDRLGGDAGDDQLYGEAGNDKLAGGDGNDSLTGGDGNDELIGDAGNDTLIGGLGDDLYYVDVAAGSDVVIDADGRNRLLIGGATRDQLWLTRSGNDLRIAVLGSTSPAVTLQGYYAATTPTRVFEISAGADSLFVAYAEPLITAMTAYSSMPAQMPTEITALLLQHWHGANAAAPSVQNQTRTTSEDVAVAGAVAAIDHDDNIVSYTVEFSPTSGSVALNAATGTWIYTPNANSWGSDVFRVLVTDAADNAALQTVAVSVTSVNDAPSDVLLAGAPSGIDERDHPQQGATLNAIVLGTLTAVDVDAPDPGDYASHVFSVTDNRFEIVGGNQLQLKANAALDYEAATTVTVAVTATDRNGVGLSYTRNFTFNVLDRDDYFYGTAGNDTITGQAGRNLIYGQGGNDVLNGANANDDLDGGDGADDLFGLGGNDVLRGGLGDDDLDGGTGADTLWGGDGTDSLLGQDGDDFLYGEVGLDTLVGGNNNDQLDGGADPDSLNGGAGDDRLIGGLGDDVLVGGTGADRFLGGSGVDRVSYAAAAAAVTVNLATGTGSAGEAAGDIFEDTPELLDGSAFNDTITGSAGADTIDGGAGNDTIYGGTGNDILNGGLGDDYIDAQSGDDQLNGGAGSDILVGGLNDDTYFMDVNSGADEIRNYDPSGDDFDVVGYQGITDRQLWFERSGDNLVVTVVGTTVRTTIKDWYLDTVTTPEDRANYKIDFFLATGRESDEINAAGLVDLMAGYTRPTTQAQYDALHANPTFENAWIACWSDNAAPVISSVGTQTINEDGTLNLTVRITDDTTPVAGIGVTVQSVQPGNPNVVDLTIVNAPTIGTPNGVGDRTLTVTTKPNRSGQVAIKLLANDGTDTTEQIFLLNVTPVADTPTLPVVTVGTPQSPLLKRTLDSGSWPVNIQGALVDQDGSETLDVRVSNVPSNIGFNTGTNLGGGVWSFGAGPWPTAITGPATWSQDLALTVTAISRETANNVTASTSQALNIEINARPTDIAANGALAINENSPNNTTIQSFSRTDADAGDTATYALTNNAGGRFAISAAGVLTTTSTTLDYEAAASHTITVLVTDSGGLTRSEDYTVNVNNVNEAPSISTTSFPIYEDHWHSPRPPGTFLSVTSGPYAVVTGSDPESAALKYELVGGATNIFGIRDDGYLKLVGVMDYEGVSNHTYSVTVRAWDGGSIGAGLSVDKSITINTQNIDEVPVISSTSFTVDEDSQDGPRAPGTVLAQVVGSDPEGATLHWQAVNGDSQHLQISDSGALIRGEYILDYEARADHAYRVYARAWDGVAVGYGNYRDQLITVNTAPVDESPVAGFADSGAPFVTWQTFHIGTITGSDPEGGPFTYEIVGGLRWWQYQGNTYGTWDYWEDRPDGVWGDESGNVFCVYRDGYNLYEYGDSWWDLGFSFGVRVTDSTQRVSATVTVTDVGGNVTVANPPVVLDLDGDGIELISVSESTVEFRTLDAFASRRTGWVAADDAMLALDRNGDGAITSFAEVSFINDLEGATSDLEGLAAYDTDGDGSFDVDDERYSEFLVWNDANQDGISQSSELRSLADEGIVAISLTRNLTGETTFGARANVITATSEFTRDDGSKGIVGDVVLASEVAGLSFAYPDEPSLAAESAVVDASAVEGEAAEVAAGSTVAEAPSEIDSGVLVDRRAEGGRNPNTVSWRSGVDQPGEPGVADESTDVSEAPTEMDSEVLVDRRGESRGSPDAGFDMLQQGSEPEDFGGSAAAARRERALDPSDEAESTPERRIPRRWPDLRDGAGAQNDEVDAFGASGAAPSALHSNLSSVVRRRLQMIEAMASFTPEGASMLELRPHRKVDARTLELLTSVPEFRVA